MTYKDSAEAFMLSIVDGEVVLGFVWGGCSEGTGSCQLFCVLRGCFTDRPV